MNDNAYKIGVAATVVVLLALGWFCVYDPITKLGEAQESLEKKSEKVTGYLSKYSDDPKWQKTTKKKSSKKPKSKSKSKSKSKAAKKEPEYLPTAAYVEFLESEAKANKADLAKVGEFYAGRTAAFGEYLPGWDTGASAFAALLNDGIEKMQAAYREKFSLPSEIDGTPAPPAIEVTPPAGDSQVAKVMKEYWMAEAIVRAFTSLDLPGLTRIAYAGSAVQQQEEGSYYAVLPVQFEARVPFAKLENLVSALLDDARVPFHLKQVSFLKDPEVLANYLTNEQVKKFGSKTEAEEASQAYDAMHPEPGVLVTVKLEAIEWLGFPPEPNDDDSEEN